MRIIPAIDIIDGKCVRLSKGDYNKKKVYNESPLEVAKSFEDNGFQYLHLVDLDGAKASHVINHKVLDSICQHTNLKVDFGGGVKSHEDIKMCFESGAHQVTLGSMAVENKPLFLDCLATYGKERIILGADAKNKMIATRGWKDVSTIHVIEFISYYLKKGIEYVVCTDIEKDGMLAGTSIDLYTQIVGKEKNIKLIASGGITNLKDLEKLKELGVEGAIIGKAIYENTLPLKELVELDE